jgi:predicted HTH transcriptional regulator
VLTVPEGTNKPYSCPDGFYLRSGPNSQKLERDSIVEFFQNEGRIRYDKIVREELPLEERFNEKAYTRFLKLAKISNVLEKETVLKNLGCSETVSGKACYTNAGAIFFRANDEDTIFQHTVIVCALYKGNNKSYIFDGRVDVTSPGGLCRGVTQENFGTVSIARNPIIADMLHRIDYIERMGTGIERMRSATREASVAEPEFDFTGFFRVSFKRTSIETVLSYDNQAFNKQKQAETSRNKQKQAEISNQKRSALSLIIDNDKTTSLEVADHIGLSASRTRAILKEMVEEGLIEKIGSYRGVYYSLKSE